MGLSSATAVVFDLDGTLLDTAPDLARALNRLRIEKDLPPLPDDTIRASVSNGARALVALGFNETPGSERFDELRSRLLELYMQDIASATELFPGLDALLRWLDQHNIGWGIATNKPALYTQALLAQLPLPSSPGIVICPDHVTHPKPDPESLLLAARHFQCAPEQLIYLGDHQRDIACGQACGAITIACLYGYIEQGDNPDSWQATHSVSDSQQLLALIQQLIREKQRVSEPL